MILGIITYGDAFIIFLILSFIVAYNLRDKSKDKEKENSFFNG
jgi:hypothetical protein